MNYGFVIDNRLCIGCHACSTACKAENEVPLGVNRTWVKYVETGVYPDTHRHFQVTRCNHCANPPCVDICPVTAMFQRADGIVDFDGDLCIGCKACIQACPYDAIYIDPESLTAAKCHYCAHRTEIGLEPACVVVCPEQAIISGDMDDPQSKIRQLIDNNKVKVRKPESGTKPNLFYIEGSKVTLDPLIASELPTTYMWSDVQKTTPQRQPVRTQRNDLKNYSDEDPVQIGGKVAEHMVQVSYDVGHKKAWHWPVAAYMTSKAIATGTYLMLWCSIVLGFIDIGGSGARILEVIVLGGMILTGILLCVDLERPERFLSVLLRPQWRSWLARGAYLIVIFGGMVMLMLTVNLGSMLNVSLFLNIQRYLSQSTIFLLWGSISVPLAIGVAVYTAYLFRQAKGREMWQAKYLPLHMGIQALISGSSICIIMATVFGMLAKSYEFSVNVLVFGLVISGMIIGIEHVANKSRSGPVKIANQHLISGKYKYWFWIGVVIIGHVFPMMVLLIDISFMGLLCGLSALCGLYSYEYSLVMSAQDVPNS